MELQNRWIGAATFALVATFAFQSAAQAQASFASSVDAEVTYAADVAIIIQNNCQVCHREGGIAPFAMDSKLAVQGWSPMIREVVMTKRMPPGQIDNKVGLKIKNEMNLSDMEMQKLVRWINAGSVVEGDYDPLAELAPGHNDPWIYLRELNYLGIWHSKDVLPPKSFSL